MADDNVPADILLGQNVDLGKYVWKQMPLVDKDSIVEQILSTQASGGTAMAVSTHSQEATNCDIQLPEESTREHRPTAQAADVDIQRWKDQVNPRTSITDRERSAVSEVEAPWK